MTEEAKAEELVDTMRGAFAQSIRASVTGLPPHQALQLADTLCTVWLDQLAGMRVTHRAKPPIDGEGIAEAWAQGKSLAEIRKQFNCSKATAYRYHPTKGARDAA